MIRLYDNPHFALRLNISVVVLVVVTIYGFWELWTAFFRAEQPDSTGALFGVLFVGGGIWGAYQTWNDHRDRVAAFDADLAAGTGVVTLWRPFTSLRLSGPLAEFKGWRFQVKVAGRGVRTYWFYFRAPGYPHELQMEVRRNEVFHEAFRKVAASAVTAFEENTGASAEPAAADTGAKE